VALLAHDVAFTGRPGKRDFQLLHGGPAGHDIGDFPVGYIAAHPANLVVVECTHC
jgi:hypothetical protein